MMERDDHRTYTHESALTRRMWYSTVTPTDPVMRRASWGQSAQTTTREVRVLERPQGKSKTVYSSKISAILDSSQIYENFQ